MSEDDKQQGQVVWYNERKGYGFVKVGDEELFIHHSVLNRFGLNAVYLGDVLTVCVTENERGGVVQEILAIERAKPKAIPLDAELREGEVKGTVKFFNAFKGYGFVGIGEDQRDVFVHLRVLRSCGIHNLSLGQQILLTFNDEGRGPQATEVRLFTDD